MTYCNALIKKYGIRVSNGYSSCLELWLELKTEGGCCVYTVYGVYTEDWDKNQFAYGIKRVLEIVGVDDLSQIQGKPVRAIFKENGGLGDIIIGIANFLCEDCLILREEELWNKD